MELFEVWSLIGKQLAEGIGTVIVYEVVVQEQGFQLSRVFQWFSQKLQPLGSNSITIKIQTFKWLRVDQSLGNMQAAIHSDIIVLEW